MFLNAFYGCTALKSIDLSNFTNISTLNQAFVRCSDLERVTFSSTTNSNDIWFLNAFYGCEKLTTITNLDKFTNITDLGFAFRDCKALTEVRLGTNPNSITGTDGLSNTFYNTNAACIKYLPSGVTDIPQSWKTSNYSNFVLPLSVAEIEAPAAITTGATLTLTVPSITPTYAYRANGWWELSAPSDFATLDTITASTAIAADKETGKESKAVAVDVFGEDRKKKLIR